MPATSPRINVTVSPEVDATVAALAKLNRTSRSAIVAEILSEALPVLSRVRAALENVHAINAQKADAIRRTIEDAQAEAERTAATALALLERIATTDGQSPQVGAKRAPGERQAAPATIDLAAARKAHLAARTRPPSANRGGENRGGKR